MQADHLRTFGYPLAVCRPNFFDEIGRENVADKFLIVLFLKPSHITCLDSVQTRSQKQFLDVLPGMERV